MASESDGATAPRGGERKCEGAIVKAIRRQSIDIDDGKTKVERELPRSSQDMLAGPPQIPFPDDDE
jgi:hypothetical protein